MLRRADLGKKMVKKYSKKHKEKALSNNLLSESEKRELELEFYISENYNHKLETFNFEELRSKFNVRDYAFVEILDRLLNRFELLQMLHYLPKDIAQQLAIKRRSEEHERKKQDFNVNMFFYGISAILVILVIIVNLSQ